MRRRPPLVCAVALAGVLALTACSGEPAPSSTGGPPVDESQLAGEQIYTNPEGPVPTAIRQASAEGRQDDVTALEALDAPTATWFSGQQEDPHAAAEQITTAAAEQGMTPVLVLYDIPARDCKSFSEGGAPDAEAYKAWVGAIGSGLGDRPAIVILEPDAIPQSLTGCEGLADPAARHLLLSESVDILRKQPGTRVYLDAGNSEWVQDLPALAGALQASGLKNTAGFSLNVSNFIGTDDTAAYGQRLSEAAGGARFVIDTSRNGAGPPPGDGTDFKWCNPEGRQVGAEPTTAPGIEGVDALLWVKQPGDSDGDCRAGEPDAGQFSLDFARDLAG